MCFLCVLHPFIKHLLYARHCARLWGRVVGKRSPAGIEGSRKANMFQIVSQINISLQTVIRESWEFPKIECLIRDLREEWDFARQKRAREGGREREAKESMSAKAPEQVSTWAIWSPEGRTAQLGEWYEMGERTGQRGQIMQGFGPLFQ